MYTQYAEVPMSKNFEPFQIIFVMDGSSSMSNYYATMIETYKKLFSRMDNVQAFQFSSSIGQLEPYLREGTDIQIAMERLTAIIENGLPQSNVCAVFVSDGQGHENAETLRARYQSLHKRYQIIFISIAVGDSFPTELSNKLREMIHNGQNSVPAILPVKSNFEFEVQFNKILNYSQQQKKIQISNYVLRNPWEGPTNIVCPGEVVAVNNNENKLTAIDGRTYVPNLTPPLTYKFIYGSLQLLIQLCTNKHPQMKSYIDMMIKYIYDVRKILEDTRAIHKIALYVDLGKAITFLESVQSGQIDLQKIGDRKLQEIMVENNPEKNQNNDSNQSDTSQNLFKEAQSQGANTRTLEELFNKENKILLLEQRAINQRFQKFLQMCSRDAQISKFAQDNQQLTQQLIDSQLLFNR